MKFSQLDPRLQQRSRLYLDACPRRDVAARVSVGIDLGTTNSAVAVVQNGKARVIANKEGSFTTPSVVSYGHEGAIVVGRQARRLATKYPRSTYYSVKRLLGRSYQEVVSKQRQLAYPLHSDAGGGVWLGSESEPRKAEHVSAELIKYLLSCVEEDCGVTTQRCVISVPAYFDTEQRAATIAAGNVQTTASNLDVALPLGLESGLDQVCLIHEPVASAFAYGLDLQRDQTVAVFDLGGGTLDICILELGRGVTEVLATGGDSHLGGDDIDAVIVDWLYKEHLSKVPKLHLTPTLKSNLKRMGEIAKIKLSTETSIKLKIPVDEASLEVRLSRKHLEKLAKPLFKRMRKALDRCCWQANVDLVTLKDAKDADEQKLEIQPKNRPPISEILLVGAATKMPAIRTFLRNMTSLEIRDTVDPEKCVALGAALEAARLSGELSQDFVMMDVWQASLMRALVQDHKSDQ